MLLLLSYNKFEDRTAVSGRELYRTRGRDRVEEVVREVGDDPHISPGIKGTDNVPKKSAGNVLRCVAMKS